MQVGLEGKKVALATTPDAPKGALHEWQHALEGIGAKVEHLGAAGTTMSPAMDYEALVVVGGAGERAADRATRTPAFPDELVQLARELMMVEKPVAAVGTAVSLLLAADVARGRALAGPEGLREAIEQAGAHWSADEMACDERLLTARSPDTDTAAVGRLVEMLSGASAQLQMDRMSEQSFPASDPPPGPSSVGGHGASQ